MPGVPGPIQRQDLDKVAKTYGKVFHFWQVDLGHDLPIGLPNVMMAVTRDGQLFHEMIQGKKSLDELNLYHFIFSNLRIIKVYGLLCYCTSKFIGVYTC